MLENKKISVILPSNQPNRLKRMLRSIEETVFDWHNVEVVIKLDVGNDFSDDIYTSLNIKYVVRESTFPDLGSMWNQAYEFATGNIIHFSGDDIVYETEGWDDIIRKKFKELPDGIGVVYGRDGRKNKRLATHYFVSRKWVDIVGYLAPPYGLTLGNDDWVHLLGKGVGRLVYVPEVITRHHREQNGENAKRMKPFWEHSHNLVYSMWGETMRESTIEKLKGAINGFINNNTGQK